MSDYKLDKISYSSLTNVYQVYDSWVAPIAISGTIAAGHINYYVVGFNFTDDAARGNVSIQNHTTKLRTPYNRGTRLATLLPDYSVYEYAASEIVRTEVRYPNPRLMQIILYIDNSLSGSTLNLITQQLDIIVDFYIAPVANA